MTVNPNNIVIEVSSTTGTGTLTLGGAVNTSVEAFYAAFANNTTVGYFIQDIGGNSGVPTGILEVGIGTFITNSTANSLVRTFVLENSYGVGNTTFVDLPGKSLVFYNRSAYCSYYANNSGGGGNTFPGGANTDIQTNDSGTFYGDSNFTYNKVTQTISVANTIFFGNSTVNATVNSTVYTGIANDTLYVGTVSAANVVSNAQLSANLANYLLLSGVAANVLVNTSNDTLYVGTVSAANVVSNAQLIANLALYQTLAGEAANVLMLTSNNALQVVSGQTNINATSWAIGNSIANVFVNSTIIVIGNTSVNDSINSTSFSGTANDTLYVGTVSAANVVSNAQLIANLSLYQTLAGEAANVLTLTANNALQVVSGQTSINSTIWSIGNSIANVTVNSTIIVIGNTSVNNSINSTSYSGTANDTLYVGTVTAANVVSNAQLIANLALYQTLAGEAANVLTLTSNNALQVVSGQTSINSTIWSIGNSIANVTTNSTVLVIGNTSVNNSINSTTYSGTANNATNLGGVAAASYQLNSTLAANVLTMTANNSLYVVSGQTNINSLAWAIGNTTANLSANSTILHIANSTASSNLGPNSLATGQTIINATSLIIGNTASNVFVNSTTITVGSNVILNTGDLAIGNSTQNTFTNSTGYYINGIAVAAGGVTSAGGANTDVQFNDSTFFNGTGGFTYNKATNNVFIANTLSIGANVILNTVDLSIGNSTQNTFVNSTAIYYKGNPVLSEERTIEYYGGKGDGSTDNTAAWTAFLADQSASNNLRLAFGAGVYIFLSNITFTMTNSVYQSISIRGMGADVTELRWTGSTDGLTITQAWAGNSFHISGITFTTSTFNAQKGLILNTTTTGSFNTQAQNDISGCTFRGSDAYCNTYYWKYCIYVTGVSSINFYNLVFAGRTLVGESTGWVAEGVGVYLAGIEGQGRQTSSVTGTGAGAGGVVRLTTPVGQIVAGDTVVVSGVGGTTEADGTWTTGAYVDGTHIDLVGTTYVHAWTSGGTVVADVALVAYAWFFTSCQFNYIGTGIYFGDQAQGLLCEQCSFVGNTYGILVPGSALNVDELVVIGCQFACFYGVYLLSVVLGTSIVGTIFTLQQSALSNGNIGFFTQSANGDINQFSINSCQFIGFNETNIVGCYIDAPYYSMGTITDCYFYGLTYGISVASGAIAPYCKGNQYLSCITDSYDANYSQSLEFMSIDVASGSAVSLSSGTAKTITSMTLPAGDWDIWITGGVTGGASTLIVTAYASISLTNNTIDFSDDRLDVLYLGNNPVFASVNPTLNVGPARFIFTSATTVYFVGYAYFSTSTCSAFGKLQARRQG